MRIGLLTFVCVLVVVVAATVVATNRHGSEAESTPTADQADNAPAPE